MKKIILIFSEEKNNLLEELGFSSNGTRDIGGGKIAYQYILTDKLHKALKQNNFSRKDYCEDVRMTF